MSDTPTNMLFAADLRLRDAAIAYDEARGADRRAAAITLRVAAHDYAAIAAFIDDAAASIGLGDAIGLADAIARISKESAK